MARCVPKDAASLFRIDESGPGVRLVVQLSGMPLTVFDIKGLPGHRRERVEAAVIAGGKHTEGPHEAWISADRFKSGFRVLARL
jgi:hypothetical protein